jgi:8-oxo-dGTP pyrophosphatase MutT (NUDIX family)
MTGPRPEPAGTTAVWRDAVARLTDLEPADAGQAELRTAYLAALEDERAVFKDGPVAHLTASCIVFDEAGERVLLTLHAKARAWLQFGGHLEVGDESLYQAACREVREESGVEGISIDPGIVELHRHTLGSRFGRCAEHLDVRFAGWAPAGAQPRPSHESIDVRWWPIEDLPEGVVADLGALISRGRERARSSSAATLSQALPPLVPDQFGVAARVDVP